ncbi:AAC(3)-I family aminoglycoside N-acetyltransferase [Pseudooceanicola lipolyticus]
MRRLRPGDDALFHGMLDLFAEVFDDAESYSSARPGQAYRSALLARDDVVMLVALEDQTLAGALVAYKLRKFEQERSEFYIYDLAVAQAWRRRGIATALIDHLKTIAKTNGGWVVYVQADDGDDPAIALYSKLGRRENVLHFDLFLDR